MSDYITTAEIVLQVGFPSIPGDAYSPSEEFEIKSCYQDTDFYVDFKFFYREGYGVPEGGGDPTGYEYKPITAVLITPPPDISGYWKETIADDSEGFVVRLHGLPFDAFKDELWRFILDDRKTVVALDPNTPSSEWLSVVEWRQPNPKMIQVSFNFRVMFDTTYQSVEDIENSERFDTIEFEDITYTQRIYWNYTPSLNHLKNNIIPQNGV